MDLLLDTNAFLWWSLADPRLRSTWIEPVSNPANTVYLSSATAWEISIKRRSGKLRFDRSVIPAADHHGFRWLDISATDAEMAVSMVWEHRDPFDRMIVAQARERNLAVVTSDEAMKSAPGVRFI